MKFYKEVKILTTPSNYIENGSMTRKMYFYARCGSVESDAYLTIEEAYKAIEELLRYKFENTGKV